VIATERETSTCATIKTSHISLSGYYIQNFFDFTMPNGSASNSSLELPANCSRKPTRSNDEKLDLAFNFLRDELGWGVSNFVTAMAASEAPHSTRRKDAFVKAAYENPEVLQSFLIDGKQRWGGCRKPIIDALDLGNNELWKEVERLGTMAPFHKFHETSNNGFDTLAIDQSLKSMQNEAPLLLRLIRGIMVPEKERRHAPKDEQTHHLQKDKTTRIVAIMSILCYSQRRNTCTGIQTSLGLYLHSNGVKRQQIELLHNLGLVVSYGTIIQAIKQQSTGAAEQVKIIGQGDDAVTAYDNFEVMESVKEQRLDHQRTFHSVTTGQVIEGIEIPPGGLRQNMLDPQAKLCAHHVLQAPGNQDDEIHRQVCR
jgi:hypothetical protein